MDTLLRKVEDMTPEERDKMKQMLKERTKDGPQEDKVEFLYKSDKPETEEYLLGRRIDRYIDDEKEKQELARKDAPGATFSEAMAKRADLDMQAKMREDPLFAIRKKEEEARRRVLENPIKMKQLQKLAKRKEEEKKKKEKKKKRKRKHSGSSDSDESSGEDELMSKYLEILRQKDAKRSGQEDSEKPAERKERENHTRGKPADKYRNDGKYSELSKKEDKFKYKRRSRSRSRERSHQRYQSKGHSRDFHHQKHNDTDSDSDHRRRYSSKSNRHDNRFESNDIRGKEAKTSKRLNASDSASDSDSEPSISQHKRSKGNRRQRNDSDSSASPERSESNVMRHCQRGDLNLDSARNHSRNKQRRKTRHSSSSSSSSSESSKKNNTKQYKRKSHRHDSDSDNSSAAKNHLRMRKESSGSDSESRLTKGYGLILPSGKQRPLKRRSRSNSPQCSQSKQNRKPSPPKREPPKRKMTAQEMETARKAMMDNAKWRDERRAENVRRYKEEDTRESEQSQVKRSKEADFLNPMLAKHASQSSVEERIKRNIYKVQRSQMDLDKKFVKQ